MTAYDFTAELWVWDARRTDRWTFVSLPTDVADEVLERGAAVARGFGSLRVRVSVGTSVWTTSIFPDDKAGTYVLPVKKAVRTAQGVDAGDSVGVHLELLDV
ncbi:hypothetical protein Cch01nite_17870 [Cellulomonas chitinilytica]|uniref:DUF1905 domain-containing protein n=1 Tax=Cellulomonas chitinilytica TaxID=398759 RepID=A0A919P0H8_9CELL|nr:DUF1905 domain-containing protein [Cellulomonas chitinilytica]GIG21063.1 hypothetical protein Cch01nite_17870 [Cellulomonas chitinilytica]